MGVANHLWQSTVFAATAALLALALKGNHARVRYWLWFTASVKFLIPFAALSEIGDGIGKWFVHPTPVPRLPLAMEQIVQPFSPIQVGVAVMPTVHAAPNLLPLLLLALWLCGFVAVLFYGFIRWRRVAAALHSSTPLTEGREFQALGRQARVSPAPRLLSSTAQLEPGTFGIFRPILWLPSGIADHLTDAELDAILAHELCHIRRRDSLTALIHMAVEAIFWFHPLVWWLSTRLTEEREQACDEEVLRMGGEPQVYAESILKVCEFYLASPLPCAAGVTGGELKQRIESILRNPLASNLTVGKKLALAALLIAAIFGPLGFGLVNAKAQVDLRNAPRFDVVSIKLNPGANGGAWDPYPVNGRWTAKGVAVSGLFVYAYGVSRHRVEGIPKELQGLTPGFNVDARMPATTTRKDFFLMMQSLLADRFHAAVHTETRDLPASMIEVSKGGIKLKPASGECVEDSGNAFLPAGQHRCHGVEFLGMTVVDRKSPAGWALKEDFSGRSITMADLAAKLSPMFADLVADDTGLTGLYDLDLTYELHPGDDQIENQINFQRTWREAWEKQAGLVIDLSKTKKRPGTVIVVDHVEAPTPN